jgi:hypothetical protein
MVLKRVSGGVLVAAAHNDIPAIRIKTIFLEIDDIGETSFLIENGYDRRLKALVIKIIAVQAIVKGEKGKGVAWSRPYDWLRPKTLVDLENDRAMRKSDYTAHWNGE